MKIKLSVIMIILLALSLSGCLEQRVENGDTVEVNYIGMLENGAVFDTSYASVAFNNSIPKSEYFQIRPYYTPLAFKVGAGEMIPGFDRAIAGMKPGETKTFTVSPEEGYGKHDPAKIISFPRLEIQTINKTHVENRTVELLADQFEAIFGDKPLLNKSLRIPGANANVTVVNITSTTIFLRYDLKAGDVLETEYVPWNETVMSVNQTSITFDINLAPNQTFQNKGLPWNSTVVAVNNTTVTLWHNSIPRTSVQTMYGPAIISFNESMINMDLNYLAGKNLTFRVELVNLTRSKK